MSIRVKNEKGIFSKLIRLLLNTAIAFVCIIAVFMVYYAFMSQIHSNDKKYKPILSFYTIVSPSMNPVIKVYDVVVNVRVNNPKDIRVGDIITYTSTNPTSLGMTITHRVVEVYESENGNYEYKTQGDNNSEPDSVLVTFDNVIGKKILIVPSLGKLQFLLANKKNWILLLLIPIAFFIFKDLYELLELFGLRKKVDAVTGEVEEPVYLDKKEKEEERKEIIKKELKTKKIEGNALVRDKNEPSGFLEPYSENILTVGKVEDKKSSKKVEPMKVVKADKIEIEEKKPEIKINNDVTIEDKTDNIVDIVNSVKNNVSNNEEELLDEEINKMIEKATEKITEKKKEKEIIEPEEKVIVEGIPVIPNTEDEEINQKITRLEPVIAPVEILDTDELTKKIKLYDDKINKLNEMLYSLEDMRVIKSKEIESEREQFKKEVQKEKERARLEIAKAKEEAKKEIEQSIKKAQEETKQVKKENKIEKVEQIESNEKDFLVGGRIKVVNVEVAQKKRTRKKTIKKIDDEVLLKTSVIPNIANNGEKKKPTVVIKDKKLKLREKSPKEVKENIDFPTTDDDLLAEINRFYKKDEKDLLFNPKIVKKIDKNDNKALKNEKVRRRGLIYLEKVKDKKRGN